MNQSNHLITPLAAMVVILSVAVLLLLFPKTQNQSTFTPTPTITLENNIYICPESGWVDCLPSLNAGVKYECTSEAINWYRVNCPDFKGAAL
ncbi:MAG: hypothetical protein UU09_C0026G0002 [Microgenomates group bacterium GW2011_GWA2_40_6]|nr:MAG: hypothetical protein UU09_C0026G0002 [Microgenomates group bacterium GW2011_GWA2_40_6]